jgi:hypothetical protein
MIQRLKVMTFEILILVTGLALLGGYSPNAEGTHFTGSSTEVILKECKEKNMMDWSDADKIKILEFCDKVEVLTTTFLQQFIHAILTGVNTTADALINKYHSDLSQLFFEYVGSL